VSKVHVVLHEMAGNVDTYDAQLEERAAPVSVLLERVRNTGVYKNIESQSLHLSKNEITWLLDPEKISWQWLRKKILASIAHCKAVKKGQVASRVKCHTKECGQLQQKMSKSIVPMVDIFSSTASQCLNVDTETWTSCWNHINIKRLVICFVHQCSIINVCSQRLRRTILFLWRERST